MADIFGYNRTKPQTVFSNDNAALDIEGKGTGYMIQQWSIGYQQNVQEIFELGSSNLYWVRGQPQGQGTFGRIIGGAGGSDVKFLPREAFDVCNGGVAMTITMGVGSCGGEDAGAAVVSLGLDGVIVTSFGFNASVQDMMIRQSVQIKFASLSDM